LGVLMSFVSFLSDLLRKGSHGSLGFLSVKPQTNWVSSYLSFTPPPCKTALENFGFRLFLQPLSEAIRNFVFWEKTCKNSSIAHFLHSRKMGSIQRKSTELNIDVSRKKVNRADKLFFELFTIL
jgi:hypothetical protein